MRNKLILSVSLIVFSFFDSTGQDCNIKNRINTDGSMYYYIEPLVFHRSAQDSLFGGVVTDKENYFLLLTSFPFPAKSKNRKLSKQKLEIVLTGNKNLSLEHFDSQYLKNDSVLVQLYQINKSQLSDLRDIEIESVRLHTLNGTPSNSYQFKMHKSAVREQLGCFLRSKK